MIPVVRRYYKRNQLRMTLFKFEEHPTSGMQWTLRDERWRPVAVLTQADHGVCLACCRLSLLSGRCVNCGVPMTGAGPALVTERGPIVCTAAAKLGLAIYPWPMRTPRWQLDRPQKKG